MSEDNSKNAQVSSTRVADTLAAAAGMMGMSVTFLQLVKDRGCPGFRGSRIYCDEVEAYVDENDLRELEQKLEEADKLDLDLRRERVRKIRFQNDIEQSRYVARDVIGPKITELGVEIKNTLRKQLEDQLPLRLEGRNATEIRAEMRKLVDQLCEAFAKGTRDLAS